MTFSSGNTTVDELMMRLMGAMEIFTAQQQEDIKDEVGFKQNQSLKVQKMVWIISENVILVDLLIISRFWTTKGQ